jgi:hypothetical protein
MLAMVLAAVALLVLAVAVLAWSPRDQGQASPPNSQPLPTMVPADERPWPLREQPRLTRR